MEGFQTLIFQRDTEQIGALNMRLLRCYLISSVGVRIKVFMWKVG